ncbi:MAG: cytochrome P450 [Deltaproteobacteria bacterium]|nr:cytochrome P450 [Deltaproteobacteria bacterium]
MAESQITPVEKLPFIDMPTTPRLPVVGSAPWLIHPEGPLARMLEYARLNREPGVLRTLTPNGQDLIFAFNVRHATEMCDESRYQKIVDGPLIRIRDFAGDGLFTADNDSPNWHKAHRILTPGFTAESMERYFPAMRSALEELLVHWRKAEAPVDVVKDMTRLTLDTISLSGFDYSFHSFAQEELHPCLKALGRALQESIDEIARPQAIAWMFGRKRTVFRRDVKMLFELVDRVVAERKLKPRETWPRDFLSMMLEEVDPKSGERLSDENIRYQILTFLVAGHETTSGMLSFALHQLSSNPALLARVRAEVEQKLGKREPTRADVLQLSLIMRILSETLRLWPTVPVLGLAPLKDELLDGRWEVPAGKPLGLFVTAVHRDPTVWLEPDKFDPDRFLPEVARQRPGASYKPFGNGKRSCIGRMFALIEAALALALIVREFDFEAPPPLKILPAASPKPAKFKLGLKRRA